MKKFGWSKLTFYIFIIGFCLGTALISIKNPAASTDMLFYTAIARSNTNTNLDKVHSQSYEMIKNRISESKSGSFKSISQWTTGIQYHQDIYQIKEAFFQQFPFFKIRVIYTQLISFISLTGVSLITATQIISIATSLLAIFILLIGLRHHLSDSMKCWLLIGSLAYGFIEVIERSSPDCLALLGVAILSILIVKKKVLICLIMLPFLILVRTNIIIINGPLLLYFWFHFKQYRVHIVCSGVISLLTYFGLNKWAGHYGWKILMHHTFVNPLSFPNSTPIQFNFIDYLSILGNQIQTIVTYNTHLLIFIIMIVVFFIKYRSTAFKNTTATTLIIVSCSTIIIHILLFPLIHVRLLCGFYLMGLIGVLIGIKEKQPNLKPKR